MTPRFRHEIWVKLLGNVAFNPISALTGATLEQLARHPDVSRVIRDIMAETEAVAARLGIELPISIDQRMAGAEKVGAHKTLDAAGSRGGTAAGAGGGGWRGRRARASGSVWQMPVTRTVYACAKMLGEKQSREKA